jgi:hypothetical protein
MNKNNTIGTFETINFPALLLQSTVDFPDEIWIKIILLCTEVDSNCDPLPERSRNKRAFPGVVQRRAGDAVRVNDYVPNDDCQKTEELYARGSDREWDQLKFSWHSIQNSFVIPYAPGEDYIHDLDEHKFSSTHASLNSGVPNPDANSLNVGTRYNAAKLLESFCNILEIAKVCKGFHAVLKHTLPKVMHFKSKRDSVSLQENVEEFQKNAIKSRTTMKHSGSLDTIWTKTSNYTKFVLVRKRPFESSHFGSYEFVMEVFPFWLIKRFIKGFDIKIHTKGRTTTNCELQTASTKAWGTRGLNCASRSTYTSVPVPGNSFPACNRISTRGFLNPQITHPQSNAYEYFEYERCVVSGLHFIDPFFLASISWKTNIPSLAKVRCAPPTPETLPEQPLTGRKRHRIKGKYVDELFSQCVKIEVHGLNGICNNIVLRPHYAIHRGRDQSRGDFGLEHVN